jgi:gliding motility-associated-like protein
MPTIAHAGMDTTIYNSFISLTGNVPLIGSGIWSVISGSGTFVNGNSASTEVNNLQTGQNVLQWTITNGACPTSFDDITITVKALIIPNGFSPNGDGVNDYFEITGIGEYNNVKLNVFNRWGNQIYESTDYKNDWNGKNMSGENLSDDTYFYTLEIPNKNTFKGYVILKRK